ncbi:MAG: DinB family protein [Pirellula sp.]|jgi:hypothetical protein|nr:DinB family protein [Pirellula sp.]
MTPFVVEPPKPDEAFEFYSTYIRLVPSGDLIETATHQIAELTILSHTLNDSTASLIHAPYTWTIKQVIGHMIDTERIFAGRLHRFACGDLQPLPGMDQEPYVANCDYESPRLGILIEELCSLRQANICLMRRLKPEQWNYRGVASGHPVTVRALGYMLVGHVIYHMQIIKKRLQRSA